MKPFRYFFTVLVFSLLTALALPCFAGVKSVETQIYSMKDCGCCQLQNISHSNQKHHQCPKRVCEPQHNDFVFFNEKNRTNVFSPGNNILHAKKLSFIIGNLAHAGQPQYTKYYLENSSLLL